MGENVQDVRQARLLETEIRDGLAEGDPLILNPGDKVHDGVAVVPREGG